MEATEMTRNLEAYFTLMTMNGAVKVYEAARDLGLLAALPPAGTRPFSELAAATGTNERVLRLLAEALAAAGLVRVEGDSLGAAPALRFFEGPYRELGNAYWAHLPAFARSGEPAVRMDDPARNEQAYAAQARSLHAMMLACAQAVAAAPEWQRLPAEARVLDVGAGSGVWSLALAQRLPAARVTALDRPAVLSIALETWRRYGLADRLECLAGDYRTVPLAAAGHDLVILGNVIHLHDPAGLAALLARCHAALKPAGLLLVADVLPDLAGDPLAAALYHVGLALRTASGRTYDSATLTACLGQAGFGVEVRRAVPVAPRTMGIVVARRAAGASPA